MKMQTEVVRCPNKKMPHPYSNIPKKHSEISRDSGDSSDFERVSTLEKRRPISSESDTTSAATF